MRNMMPAQEDGKPEGAGEPGPQASDRAQDRARTAVELPWAYEAGCWHLGHLDEDGGFRTPPSAASFWLAVFALLGLGLVVFVAGGSPSVPLLLLLGVGALALLGFIAWRLIKSEPQGSAPDQSGDGPG
jgi:hypothetical protein